MDFGALEATHLEYFRRSGLCWIARTGQGQAT